MGTRRDDKRLYVSALAAGCRLVCGQWRRPRQSRRLRGAGAGVEIHSAHRRVLFKCRRAAGGHGRGVVARSSLGALDFRVEVPQTEVLMAHRNIKVAVTAVVLASAFGFMMWTTLRDGAEYFKHVDEVVAQRPTLEGKKLQVQGYVIPGSILVKPNTLEYRFKIQNNPIRAGEPGNVMNVTYEGVVPDTFKDEAEVVANGQLRSDGGLDAN